MQKRNYDVSTNKKGNGMSKKLFLLAFLFVLSMLTTNADAMFLYENVYYEPVNDSVAEVVKARRTGRYFTITIPQTVEYENRTYAVEGIRNRAFAENQIDTLVIGNNVKRIGEYAFKNAVVENVKTSLKTWLNIDFEGGESTPVVGYHVYATIEKDDKYYELKTVNHRANVFFDGVLVDSIIIPKNVKKIKDWVFTGFKLKYLNADSVNEIGVGSFRSAEINEFSVSKALKTIGDTAFYESYMKKNVGDFNGVKDIGVVAFGNAVGLETPPFGDSIETIGDYAFYPCLYYEEGRKTKIGKSIKFIGVGNSSLFWGDELNIADIGAWMNAVVDSKIIGLPKKVYVAGKEMTPKDTLVIPETVSYVGPTNMLVFCKSCSSVVIPQTVTSIARFAFFNRSDPYTAGNINLFSYLKSIIVENPTPPLANWETFPVDVYRNCELVVPKGAESAYLNAEPWRQFTKFSGVDDVERDGAAVRVSVSGCEIMVDGAAANAVVEAYSASGQLVYKGTAGTFTVPGKGIYIVRVRGKAIKVAV